MKRVTDQWARQGDLLIRPVAGLPNDVDVVQPEGGRHVLAHSETGHDHDVAHQLGLAHYRASPMVGYLTLDAGVEADLVHHRAWDTHETFRLEGGESGRVFEIRRQREHTPEGWRRVED